MPTWIDEKLAIAPMPSEDQIPELAKTFKAVVILVEDQELDYDIHQWEKFGVKVKHMPIPDFGTPGLNVNFTYLLTSQVIQCLQLINSYHRHTGFGCKS